MVVSIIVIIAFIAVVTAVKWYIAALSAIYLMNLKGINPKDDELKSATIYVCKKLLKIRQD